MFQKTDLPPDEAAAYPVCTQKCMQKHHQFQAFASYCAESAAPGLLFHSDRGVQYAAAAYREELEKLGFIQSMSRKGEPHDNAVAENFFSCLKCELVYLRSYVTRSQAQNSVFRYIGGFFNPIRPHSSIGWMSPMAYEQKLKCQNAA